MDERRAYEERKEAELQDLSTTLVGLLTRVESTGTAVGPEDAEGIQALRAKQEEVQDRLRILKGATDDTWEQFRTGLETSWRDLKTALDEVASRLGPLPR